MLPVKALYKAHTTPCSSTVRWLLLSKTPGQHPAISDVTLSGAALCRSFLSPFTPAHVWGFPALSCVLPNPFENPSLGIRPLCAQILHYKTPLPQVFILNHLHMAVVLWQQLDSASLLHPHSPFSPSSLRSHFSLSVEISVPRTLHHGCRQEQKSEQTPEAKKQVPGVVMQPEPRAAGTERQHLCHHHCPRGLG